MQKKITLTSDSHRCSTCMLNSLCLPVGMSTVDIARFEEVVQERIRVPKGDTLFNTGDPAQAIYGIRVGSMKTQLEDATGHIQVTGFLLPGEIVGLDGFLEGKQLSHAIALEDTEVCVARVNEIDRVIAHVPALQHQLRRLTSQEIKRSQQLVMALGVLRSEQRLAAFLVNMSQRLSILGYSSTEFILRMSREEIGSYLGLTLETVSRLFSRFAKENLIRIHQREVQLLDLPALRELAGSDYG
ncbi:helix-turn-helix domain-containing protein [Pusillimonas minor]|uniref:Helix-turn-helix domain-containing protein n=1 Tax=Pusillimonas minor TaxID=2697024 RepID=A0A842HM90_9BURK|nr:helix-turn-helix domain-containing protein [Pusillimonas minor]MBC2768391.1 helix-turn-helix domain-containing protein [Pusillimonas minor]